VKLYDYFRSSAAYRVRIALNLKGLGYEHIPVNLLKGEEGETAYRELNPQGLVPTLVDEGKVLTQSLAICEYLEECYPEPSLLPGDASDRARIRSLALAVACDIHPLNNLRLLKYLVTELGASEEQKLAWYQHWINEGFEAIEAMLNDSDKTAAFCHGNTPTLADLCLVPQLYNARRFEVDLTPFPNIVRINENCLELDAFLNAKPENQPDSKC
jgi:maleylacetoacetate isomerase